MPELLTVIFLTTKVCAALEITPNYLVHGFVGCQSELGSAEWFFLSWLDSLPPSMGSRWISWAWLV